MHRKTHAEGESAVGDIQETVLTPPGEAPDGLEPTIMHFSSSRFSLVLCAAAVLLAPAALSDDGHRRGERRVIRSQPLTGSFQIYGQPRWYFGAPLGSPGGPAGEHVAEYNPGGDPIPLSADTPCDAVLATQIHPSSPYYDPELVNIPLNEVPITVNGAGDTASLPPISEAGITEQSRSLPNDPVTLGDWLGARGRAKIRCAGEDSARIRIKFRGLVPNALYTLWGFMELPEGGVGPRPLGGVPNAFVPNANGSGSFDRALNFCPLADDSPLLDIVLALHTDGSIFGAVPAMADAETSKPVGVIVHAQAGFPVNAEEVLDVEEGCRE
jgi:hypothetical protein